MLKQKFCSTFAAVCRQATFLKVLVACMLTLLPVLGTAASAQTTTISGTVFAPNGADYLPNVLVYITTGTVAAITTGATCDQVSVPSNAVVSTYTAINGTFTLSGVPENTTYTLVIQAGKWRRQFPESV